MEAAVIEKPDDSAVTLASMHQPSRPEELRPESLTDPDVTLSRHPARATQ
jgi:hypothetical protein